MGDSLSHLDDLLSVYNTFEHLTQQRYTMSIIQSRVLCSAFEQAFTKVIKDIIVLRLNSTTKFVEIDRGLPQGTVLCINQLQLCPTPPPHSHGQLRGICPSFQSRG